MKTEITNKQALAAARATIFSQLHVVEFWMPQLKDQGNCNLKCTHCYVPCGGRASEEIMSADEYSRVLAKIMRGPAYGGKWDVVFPGMEPLLPRNLPLVLRLSEEAQNMGARSIGMTTNGVLLKDGVLDKIVSSSISTVNVSLDGPKEEHDQQRGREGLFDITTANIACLCKRASEKKVITNTTITSGNAMHVGDVVAISRDLGCAYAAFHPFEVADNADNRLALSPRGTAEAVDQIMDECVKKEGSVAIEFEASTAPAFTNLWKSGTFSDMELVADETGFLFLRKKGKRFEILVNVMFYPHHFIRTLRVMDDGSLSSCRRMALNGWRGVGNLRNQSLGEIATNEEVINALAQIWEEFLSPECSELESFLNFLEKH